MKKILTLLLTLINGALIAGAPNNPIMFVTQFPTATDFGAIGSTFGNHQTDPDELGRGGDLYIRYVDGNLRNLTREAGFGMVGLQTTDAIAIRDPSIHWSGTRALFSMVIGTATENNSGESYYWQIYEATGFGQGQALTITKIANQPVDYSNITPIYASDDNIIFTSDMPRTKNRYNYPQYEEYDSARTVTGLWKLDIQSGEVNLLQHSPSGSFSPLIDAAGRIIFTRWDHLQRDQQAESSTAQGRFNYSSELPGANILNIVDEIFPEPHDQDPALNGTNMNELTINHFFPWQLNQDGTGEETLNHVGRQELHDYFTGSVNDDANIVEFIPYLGRPNVNTIRNTFMLDEDPNQIGRYLAIDAPEFGTYNAGQIIAFDLPVGARPDLVEINYLTHPSTRNPGTDVNHSGFYRDAITLNNGTVVSSHTVTTSNNNSVYQPFLIKTLQTSSGYLVPDSNLTNLGNVSISYWDFNVGDVSFTGRLWELQPVEVKSRTIPPVTSMMVQSPEQLVMNEENVNPATFINYLKSNNLAVVVMRDVTTRDSTDKQQPYNLKVANSTHQTIGSAGTVYDISHMQFVQADQIRGQGGTSDPALGQRVLAQYMHDSNAIAHNIAFAGAPTGSMEIYSDGSVAAFVPTQRAMAWQSIAPDTTPIVRERYWITFQPGEIRACGGCHGVNNVDQAGNPESTQKADAFRALLQHWKQNLNTLLFSNGFE